MKSTIMKKAAIYKRTQIRVHPVSANNKAIHMGISSEKCKKAVERAKDIFLLNGCYFNFFSKLIH